MAIEVRFGMVGGSLNAFIANVHREAASFDHRIKLVAGCFSRNAQLNRETGETLLLDPDRVYGTFAEMAEKESAREDGINLVAITAQNYVHYEAVKCFLEHGINVICEKPLCFEIAQAEELTALAKEKNLVFCVMYSYSGYTMLKVAKEMIAKGKVGDIISVNAEYIQEWLIDDLGTDDDGTARLSVWRKIPEEAGMSNCVGDIGTHIENTVHYLTGLKIKRLSATVNRFGKPLDLNANMLLEFENGANGAYWCSQVAIGKMNGLVVRIYGTEGAIEWEQHFPDYLKYTRKGRAPQMLSRGCGYLEEASASYSRIPSGHPEGLVVAFANVYKNVISAVINLENGGSADDPQFDYPRGEDGVNGVKFIHAVIESGDADAKWVEL